MSKAEEAAFKAFDENIVRVAKENFLRDKGLESMIFIGMEKGKEITFIMLPVGEFMKNSLSKDWLSLLLHTVGKGIKPLCICLVTECWMVKADKDGLEEAMKVRPANHPDRVEALLYSFESENILKQKMSEVVRDGDLVSLKDDTEYSDNAEGRFVNVLKDLKKIKFN